jgi:hypothetical protein
MLSGHKFQRDLGKSLISFEPSTQYTNNDTPFKRAESRPFSQPLASFLGDDHMDTLKAMDNLAITYACLCQTRIISKSVHATLWLSETNSYKVSNCLEILLLLYPLPLPQPTAAQESEIETMALN